MNEWQSLAHVKWACKYHIAIVTKCRRMVLFRRTRKQIGRILRQLSCYKGVEMLEGHAMRDHIHMMLSLPPKYSIAMMVGYLKGKSAIQIHRQMQGDKEGIHRQAFLAKRVLCKHRRT